VNLLTDVWEFYRTNRQDLVPLATFAAGVIAAWVGLGQLRIARWRHEAQTRTDLQRRISESFVKATEQIADDKLAVRLGGIHVLGRIARESEADCDTIIQMLASFIRNRAPLGSEVNTASPTMADFYAPETPSWVPEDVSAALSVIGQPDIWKIRQSRKLADLRLGYCNFRDLRLQNAKFEQYDGFRESDFRNSVLSDVDFRRADLWGANFAESLLFDTSFREAMLFNAHFEKSSLAGTDLYDADLRGVHFEGAKLMRAKGLTQKALNNTHGDADTSIPKNLARPPHWPPASAAATEDNLGKAIEGMKAGRKWLQKS
jgi:Pentapeptide repeats (9 copies)